MSFTQLNNALKTINSYYKQATYPNFKTHIKNAVENFLRDDIKRGIESIFAQNESLAKEASELFNTALSDYAQMKDILKRADKLRLRDEALSQEQAFSRLFKYIQGQGELGGVSNFEKLAQGFNKTPELRERFELGFLQNIFEKTFQEIERSAHIFNSKEFFKRLEGMEEMFQSKAAKDYIQIAKNFDTLFKNDFEIAQALRKTTTEKIGSSIATSIEGAVKFQVVKSIFEHIIRLLPHIPFMKNLNEKIQGAALRYHIKRAFMNAIDVSDFTISLKAINRNTIFNNATKEVIESIVGEVRHAQEDIVAKVLQRHEASSPKQALESYQTDT